MGGLFNSTVLDIIIGLSFIYLLLAILCTAANEWIASLLKSRAKLLKEGILQLLSGQTIKEGDGAVPLADVFYRHPLIIGMMRGDKYPAYLSSKVFAATINDIISGANKVATFTELQSSIDALPDGNVKKTLSALLKRAGGDLERAHEAIEGWFNEAMDRVTGWYKQRTQVWTVVIAAVLVILSNADTLQIARRLWTDPVLRNAVVAEAQTRSKLPPPTVEYPDTDDPTAPAVSQGNQGNQVSENEQKLLNQLLGDWQTEPNKTFWQIWSARALGWFLTILAVSLGAPFWFDLLNRFINIRGAGKSPDEKAKAPEKPEKPTREEIPKPNGKPA